MSARDDLIDRIAPVAHEATRAYQQSLGQTPNPPWEQAPDWLRESIKTGIRAILDTPAITPVEQHERWMALRHAQGWVYGPRKDTTAKAHPDLVPYTHLSEDERRKNILFHAVVRALAYPA